jgi:hypothetical protein
MEQIYPVFIKRFTGLVLSRGGFGTTTNTTQLQTALVCRKTCIDKNVLDILLVIQLNIFEKDSSFRQIYFHNVNPKTTTP